MIRDKLPEVTELPLVCVWASWQIHIFASCACAGNAGHVYSDTDFKGNGLVSDPGMHHGTCVTHLPWCKSGSLVRGGGNTFPAFPAHAQPANMRIWQEAHCIGSLYRAQSSVHQPPYKICWASFFICKAKCIFKVNPAYGNNDDLSYVPLVVWLGMAPWRKLRQHGDISISVCNN